MKQSAPPAARLPLSRILSDEGLRLFFPLGAIYAALWPLQWLLFGLDLPLTRATPPAYWHAHEMIYGAFGAALLGFLTTSVPEWTDTRRPASRFLFLLAGLWLGGRLVGFWGFDLLGWPGALCDAAWLLVLAGYVIRISWQKRNTRIVSFAGWVIALAVVALGIQYAFSTRNWMLADRLLQVSGLVFLGLLGLALARITVSVNNRMLDPSRASSPYRPHPGRRNLASGLIAVAVLTDLSGFSAAVSGYVLLAAGAAFMDRAGESFIGRKSFRAEVLVLLASSLLAGSGLILTGLTRLGWPLAPAVGLHLALMGGLGLGVMSVYSIAGLLHTGQQLAFPRGAKWGAALLVLAVFARIAPQLGIWPAWIPGNPFLPAALLWAAAFLVWLHAYWPLLAGEWTLEARKDSAPLA